MICKTQFVTIINVKNSKGKFTLGSISDYDVLINNQTMMQCEYTIVKLDFVGKKALNVLEKPYGLFNIMQCDVQKSIIFTKY